MKDMVEERAKRGENVIGGMHIGKKEGEELHVKAKDTVQWKSKTSTHIHYWLPWLVAGVDLNDLRRSGPNKRSVLVAGGWKTPITINLLQCEKSPGSWNGFLGCWMRKGVAIGGLSWAGSRLVCTLYTAGMLRIDASGGAGGGSRNGRSLPITGRDLDRPKWSPDTPISPDVNLNKPRHSHGHSDSVGSHPVAIYRENLTERAHGSNTSVVLVVLVNPGVIAICT
ncbi:hypothetical protein EGW08_017491 [Elysia chlorotica]|uniref:Uncharacterized protein n=1 Tax=Elysia chlorotica TaxID=188477 RepID=A0A3S1B2T5_ELYCH|nr:hypothetical protein EGW08_017491 [Elysia chlorotica]